MAGKHWYWKFNVDAWLTEQGLAVCSLEAQGLWFRCLCMMFKNDEHRGFLEHRGKQITADWLAKSCGTSAARVTKLLKELEAAEVFSRDERGVIFSRRMVRDEELRQQSKENGKLGGNPTLTQGVNPPDNPLPTGGVNPSVTTNYVTNNSSLKEGVQGETERRPKPAPFNPAEVTLPAELDTLEFRAAWREWCDFRRASRKPISELACSKQLAKLAKYGEARSVACIAKAIENDHQGLYPESIELNSRGSPVVGKQTAGDHNQASADIVRERINAARSQLEARPAGGLLGFTRDTDEP